MTTAAEKIEQIVGLVGFIDGGLDDVLPEQESQFVGLFRVSPEEEEYREFQARLKPIDSHFIMRAALEAEDKRSSIVCASKLLKSIVGGLDQPLLPMSWALERFDPGEETDKSVIAAMLADSYLQCIAKNHSGELAVAWAAAGAQLFALLCHAARTPLTKMNEYALAVCFLPSLSGTRSTRPEELMAEQQQIMAFQKSHRDGSLPTRVEALIKYGRRIWGAVYDCLPSLQYELEEMARALKVSGGASSAHRKRDKVLRFFERATQPITGRLHRASETSAASGAAPLRRPSIITRAFSMDRRSSQSLVVAGAPPSSSLDATFLPSSAGGAAPPPPPLRAIQLNTTQQQQPYQDVAFTRTPSGSQLPVPQRRTSRVPLDGVAPSSSPQQLLQRRSGSSSNTLTASPLPTNGGALPRPMMRSTSASSNSGAEGTMSANVKAAAHNSAIKRRLSREGLALPPPAQRQSSSNSGYEAVAMTTASGSHLERPLSGSNNGTHSLSTTRRFSAGRGDDSVSNGGGGSSRRLPTSAAVGGGPLEASTGFKKERQPSLGDLGRHIIQSLDSELAKGQQPSTPGYVERDSDLL